MNRAATFSVSRPQGPLSTVLCAALIAYVAAMVISYRRTAEAQRVHAKKRLRLTRAAERVRRHKIGARVSSNALAADLVNHPLYKQFERTGDPKTFDFVVRHAYSLFQTRNKDRRF